MAAPPFAPKGQNQAGPSKVHPGKANEKLPPLTTSRGQAGPGQYSSDVNKKIAQLVIDEAPKTLINLNDDCLLCIFGGLSLMDLCNMYAVSKRFQPCVELIFRRKHNLKINMVGTSFNISTNNNYQHILQTFGQTVQSLVISKRSFDVAIPEEDIVHCILANCHDSLQHLELIGFSLVLPQENNDMKLTFCRMVSNLKTLRLNDIELRNGGVIFEFLSGLEELHLNNVRMDSATSVYMKRVFPHLHSVTIKDVDLLDCTVSAVHTFFSGFLKTNETIKKLVLVNSRVSPTVLRVITNQMPVLEDLTVRVNVDSQANVLQQLQHVKRLYLDIHRDANVAPLLTALSTKSMLTHLEIHMEYFRQHVIQSLANFNSLKCIHLIASYANFFGPVDDVFMFLSSGLTSVVDFRANCFYLQNTDTLIQFAEKNTNLEVFWLSSMFRAFQPDLRKFKLMASKRSPSAPKLVVILMGLHATTYSVFVEKNVVLVQPCNGPAQPAAYELGCFDPFSEKYSNESRAAFIEWCRSSASNGESFDANFVVRPV